MEHCTLEPAPHPRQASLLESLRLEVSSLGGTLGDGWRVEVKPRGEGSHSAGKGADPYYVSPSGKKFRSRKEARRPA